MLNFCKLGVQVRKEREKARLRAEGEKNVYYCEYYFLRKYIKQSVFYI
jgi:hypothetical protein